MFNSIFSFLTSFCIGMLLATPPLYSHKHRLDTYSFVPDGVMFPKHPVVECVRDLDCSILAEAAYYEARGEEDFGVMLVMQTILNRVNHSKWGDNIEEVVYEPKQFSYTHDGSLEKSKHDTKQWARMYFLAYQFLSDKVEIPEEWDKITHYHSKSVNPSWAKYYQRVVVVGNHIGYVCNRRC